MANGCYLDLFPDTLPEGPAAGKAADGRVFRAWARLMHGKPDDVLEDALIAVTAIVHDLAVVTRNVRDFARFGVRLENPFVPTGE